MNKQRQDEVISKALNIEHNLCQNYSNDLNELILALEALLVRQDQWIEYENNLKKILVREYKWPNYDIPSWRLLSAKPYYCTEALLKTLNLWEE